MQEECIVCKAPLIYLEQDEWMECELCHKKELSKTRCQNGHYVCNDCHTKGLDTILSLCIDETSRNPIEIVRKMMDAPFCHMHGPEHHVMVGAALLTAYKNAGGAINLRESVMEMLNRGKAVPGGTCGFWGACGAGISAGMFVIMFAAVSNFSNCVNEIVKYYGELKGDCRQINNLHNILNVPYQSGNQNAENEEKARELVLENVSFRYSEGKAPTIQGINLHIKAGEKVALIGVNGAGKTTLINLLMRFYDVNSGTIKVSDIPLQQLTRKSLRDNYGMVLQETWLRSGSIRDNIAMGKPDATDEEIIAAAKASHAHGFIKRLPEGYDTVIAEDGGNLSQGQKQLLCIARVMLCLPPMLILDEATSSIDTRTEIKIQKAFNTLMKNRTTFIVAHRLSTIQNADLILVMNNGNIIEQGTHTSLYAQKGFYYNLYNSQFSKT